MTKPFLSSPNDLGKLCAACKERKLWEEFPVNNSKADGYDIRCKACMQIKNKAQYERHAEKRRAYAAQYAEDHPEQRSEYGKKYREEHREELNAYLVEYRKTHEVIRSEESKERQRVARREKYASSPEFREAVKERSQIQRLKNPAKRKQQLRDWYLSNREKAVTYNREYQRRFRKTEAGKEFYRNQRIKHRDKRLAQSAAYNARRYNEDGLLPSAYLSFLHKWQDMSCFYCHVSLEAGKTLEHIVPLKRGGTNLPHNVVYACGTCNFSKGSRLLHLEWTPEIVRPKEINFSKHGLNLMVQALTRLEIPHQMSDSGVVLGTKTIRAASSFWQGKLSNIDFNSALHIFEHEWIDRSDAVLNVLKAKAGMARSFGARTLSVESPGLDEAKEFMNKWHIRGFAGGQWYLGLRNKEGWQAMAAFKQHALGYELVRMTFKDHVAGGLSKLIQAFLKSVVDKLPIFSYCDLRFGPGAGYLAAGFTHVGDTDPSYGYANGSGMFDRRNYTLDRMAINLDWFDPSKSGRINALVNGLLHINLTPQRRFLFTP